MPRPPQPTIATLISPSFDAAKAWVAAETTAAVVVVEMNLRLVIMVGFILVGLELQQVGNRQRFLLADGFFGD